MLNHLLSSTCVQHAKTFAKCYSIKHLQNIFRGVTCEIKHNKTFLQQMFYFTCNHGLTSRMIVKRSVVTVVSEKIRREKGGSETSGCLLLPEACRS